MVKPLEEGTVFVRLKMNLMDMVTQKEVKKYFETALKEIGAIEPWFDKEVNEWVFSHPNYPVEYGGGSADEVIKSYPKYLREFIKERLNNNLNLFTEKRTKGHGGKRKGAGRPKGSVKEEKERVVLPRDIAFWFKHDPKAIDLTRNMIKKTSLYK